MRAAHSQTQLEEPAGDADEYRLEQELQERLNLNDNVRLLSHGGQRGGTCRTQPSPLPVLAMRQPAVGCSRRTQLLPWSAACDSPFPARQSWGSLCALA